MLVTRAGEGWALPAADKKDAESTKAAVRGFLGLALTPVRTPACQGTVPGLCARRGRVARVPTKPRVALCELAGLSRDRAGSSRWR